MPMPSAVSTLRSRCATIGLGDQTQEVLLAHRVHRFMSALTGSSAAARRAGRMPNTRPLAIATPTADADAHGGAAKSSTGNKICMSQHAAGAERERRRSAPSSDRHAASVEEQREDLPVARADRLQQADLGRALAHGDEHHVHDQHAGDDEADRGDAPRGPP